MLLNMHSLRGMRHPPCARPLFHFPDQPQAFRESQQPELRVDFPPPLPFLLPVHILSTVPFSQFCKIMRFNKLGNQVICPANRMCFFVFSRISWSNSVGELINVFLWIPPNRANTALFKPGIVFSTSSCDPYFILV